MYQFILCVNSKIRKGILKRLIFNPQTLSFISVGASIQKMLMILKKVLLCYMLLSYCISLKQIVGNKAKW